MRAGFEGAAPPTDAVCLSPPISPSRPPREIRIMRHHIVRAVVVAILVGGTSLAIAYSTGPPASYSGAPAVGGMPAEGLCTVCHSTFANDVNDPLGSLHILDVPQIYTPGQTYTLRVQLGFLHPPADTPLWGFQFTAVRADSGTGAGSFTTGPELQVKAPAISSVFKTRRYVEHTPAALWEGEPGPVEWSFDWTAPTRDVGKVYFYCAGNAANGNGLNTGDHIYTAVDSVLGDTATVSVPRPGQLAYRTFLDPIYPNPFARFCDMSFTVGRAGFVDLAVFDVQGRRVYTVFQGQHPAGPTGRQWNGIRQDGRPAPNGVYFIKLMAPGLEQPLSRRVTLTR